MYVYVCVCVSASEDNIRPRSIYHNIAQDTLGALKSLSVETLELPDWMTGVLGPT